VAVGLHFTAVAVLVVYAQQLQQQAAVDHLKAH
jgi:hypothetical protein